VAEQLREDFSLIPGLLAEALPDPAPLPPLDESAPDDDKLRPVEVGPDQMDLFA
jgi:hypothetical protein